MSIKVILVHLATDEQHRMRLNTALKLARKHGAHITALFLTQPLGMPYTIAGRGASLAFIKEAVEAAREHAERLRQEFNRECEDVGVSHTWVVEDGDHLERLSHHAHVADLAIISQTDPHFLEEQIAFTLPESIAMQTGCPVLMLPKAWDSNTSFGHNIAIAWSSTREAVRSVRNAVPLLRMAEHVSILCVHPDDKDVSVHPDEVVNYLCCHGVNAVATLSFRDKGSAAPAILQHAQEIGTDLLVMGAYGHSKVHELLFGGVTRHIIAHAELPLFMSH